MTEEGPLDLGRMLDQYRSGSLGVHHIIEMAMLEAFSLAGGASWLSGVFQDHPEKALDVLSKMLTQKTETRNVETVQLDVLLRQMDERALEATARRSFPETVTGRGEIVPLSYEEEEAAEEGEEK